MQNKLLYACFLALVLTASCKKYPKDDPYPPKKVIPVDSNYLYHFSGKVDTAYFSVYEGSGGYTNSALNTKNTPVPPDSPTVIFTSSIKTAANTNSITISKGVLKHAPPSPTDNEFEAFFQTGSYPYAGVLNPQGIMIEWMDENGNSWSTLNGEQLASSFNITEVSKKYVSGVTVLDTRCTFTCTVYDINGNPRIIESAEFYGTFKNN